jgi:hypothetical protein
MACGARRQRVALAVDGGAWRREAVAHGGRGCQRVVRSDRVSESKRDAGVGLGYLSTFDSTTTKITEHIVILSGPSLAIKNNIFKGYSKN